MKKCRLKNHYAQDRQVLRMLIFRRPADLNANLELDHPWLLLALASSKMLRVKKKCCNMTECKQNAAITQY